MLETCSTQLRTFDNNDCMSRAQVGDDLTVTNVTRVKKAIDDKACNAWLGQGSAASDFRFGLCDVCGMRRVATFPKASAES